MRYVATPCAPPHREGGAWAVLVKDTRTGDEVWTGHLAPCGVDAALLSLQVARDWSAAIARDDARPRMFRDITLPFVVGMASSAWAVACVYFRWPEALSALSVPGVAYASWKLAPFLWGKER